jgi:hypothetical protein
MDGRNLDRRALTNAAMVKAENPIQQLQTDIDYLFESELFTIGEDKTSIVDSKNVSRRVKQCLTVMIDTNTSPGAKIKLADFICNKLHGIYNLKKSHSDIVVKHLVEAVLNGAAVPIPLRLYYLRFRNDKIPHAVSVDLFKKGVRDKIRLVPYFQILKYILRAGVELSDESWHQEILEEFEAMFASDDVSLHTKMEIADIFILNSHAERGHRMLDDLRQLEHALNRQLSERRTIYEDTQNVHTSALNDSVLKACVRLMELEPPVGFDADAVRELLCQLSPDATGDITTVIERVEIDTSRFRSEGNLFGLYDIFSSLWSFISKHEHCQALYLRLIEEITSMSRFCTTGHASRFINVIQGYVADDALQIRISDEQQIKAVVSAHLDRALADTDEAVLDSVFSDESGPFYDFVQDRINFLLPSLLEEYETDCVKVVEAVRVYSKWEHWSIVDNKIIRDPGE